MSFAVGVIGFGAIAQDLVPVLRAEAPGVKLAVLTRAGRTGAAETALGAAATSDLGAFLAARPKVVAECAGHGAVAEVGPAILRAGADLVVASVGALADAALQEALQAAARAGGAQVIVPSGAIGGVDLLSAARLSGLTAVRYTGRKPPAAWAGTPAEAAHDLAALTRPTTIFEGSARSAALAYPKNANVAATLALAGLGLDRTEVRLIADPQTAENVHEVSLASGAVEASLRLVGKPSPRNPKTSQTTALSVARAVLNRDAALVL